MKLTVSPPLLLFHLLAVLLNLAAVADRGTFDTMGLKQICINTSIFWCDCLIQCAIDSRDDGP